MKKSRGSLSSNTKRLKGKTRPTPVRLTQSVVVGTRVLISPSSYRAGVPPLRYAGRHGIVREKRGRSYVVEIRDGGKTKQLVCHPVHLVSSSHW